MPEQKEQPPKPEPEEKRFVSGRDLGDENDARK